MLNIVLQLAIQQTQKQNQMKNIQKPISSQISMRQSLSLKKPASTIPSSSDQISTTFTLLHQTIDNLDTKVHLLLQKHQAQFLFAWRNHIVKIKKQLNSIRQKADQKQKQLNSNEKIISMQKQMIVFRDQSLKLYQENTTLKQSLDLLKRKIKQQQQELQIIKNENKELIKTTKLAQAKVNIYNDKMQYLENQLNKLKLKELHNISNNHAKTQINNLSNTHANNLSSTYVNNLNFHGNNLNSHGNSLNKTNYKMSRIQSKTMGVQRFISSQKLQSLQKQHPVYQLFPMSRLKSKRASNLNYAQDLSIIQLQSPNLKRQSFSNPTYDSQLKSYFLECIGAIKKQISSRKSGFNQANQIWSVESLKDFMTIDKLRLLEMFLQNQKLITYIYGRMFPDRMAEVRDYFVVNKQAQSLPKQSQTKYSLPKQSLPQSYQTNQAKYNQNVDEMLQQIGNNTTYRTKTRFKSTSKGSKSQPIKNRMMMKDGKLNLIA